MEIAEAWGQSDPEHISHNSILSDNYCRYLTDDLYVERMSDPCDSTSFFQDL